MASVAFSRKPFYMLAVGGVCCSGSVRAGSGDTLREAITQGGVGSLERSVVAIEYL